jgi:hypothetical protein
MSEHKLVTSASGTAIEIRSNADRETPVIFVGMPGALVVKAFADHNNFAKARVYMGDLSDFIGKVVEDKKDEAPVDKKDEAPVDKKDEAPVDKKDEAPVDKKEEAPVDNKEEAPVDKKDEAPVDNKEEA